MQDTVIIKPYLRLSGLEFSFKLILPSLQISETVSRKLSMPFLSNTTGIILCTIKYTLGKNNKQIFASKYKMDFPEKQILKLIREQ